MIINHEHKFLFVHIHKTAGSSIRNSLLQSIPGSFYLGYDHSFLSQVPNIDKYKDYFKFCMVRNPWDRLVSWYYSILNLNNKNSFKQYFEANCSDFSGFLRCTDVIIERDGRFSGIIHNNEILLNDPNFVYLKSISFNQLDYITDVHGNVAVDYIGRFEDINECWKHICSVISLDIPLRKDKIGDWRNDSLEYSYRKFYSDEEKEFVASMYKRDIDYFNYKF